MHDLVIYTDGGARGNPGPAAVGVVMKAGEWEDQHQRYIGETTNNVAEYTAVLDALDRITEEVITREEVNRVTFFLDSELIVKQILGQYRVKEPTLQELNASVHQRLADLSVPYTFSHVPRAQNVLADKLVNRALDEHQMGRST